MKNWQLSEFTFKDVQIIVSLQNDKSLAAPLSELKVRTLTQNNGRVASFTYNENKIHFQEICYMLQNEEWDKILEIL